MPSVVIAFLGDAHGNWLAFDAACRDAAQHGATHLACVGDLTYGTPGLAQVVRAAQNLGMTVTLGNCDAASLYAWRDGPRNAIEAWQLDELDEENWHYLASLPTSLVCHGRVYLTHGTPRALNGWNEPI